MPGLIDRQSALSVCKECCFLDDDSFIDGYNTAIKDIRETIKELPTIEQGVHHGEWHESWYTDTVCASICTNCGKAATQARTMVGQELTTNVRYPLCPNCGARMGVTGTNVGGKGGAENGGENQD